MAIKQLLDDGQLAEAIEAATAEVRARPTESTVRTTLFELLSYAGEWDRAARQLDALGGPETDPKLQAGIHVYRELIDAERKRAALFEQGVRPRFILVPPPDVVARLDALACLLDHRESDARDAIQRADATRTATAGEYDGLTFADIRDADDLLAPVLEVFTRTGYFWVPWSQIQYLEIAEPSRFRDLLWAPAKLASLDGQLGEVHLPSLYPGTSTNQDDLIRLGRRTDWVDEAGGAIVRGRGRKVILLGEEARTIADLRVLRFEVQPSDDRAAPESSSK